MARQRKTDLDIPPPPPAASAAAPLRMLREETPRGDAAAFPPRLLLTGVAVACLAGAGAGLWARPLEAERRLPAPARATPQVSEAGLRIVVDEAPPAPVDKPLEVLRADATGPAFILPPPVAASTPPPEAPAEPEPRAPRREPDGLVRVVDIAPEPAAAPVRAKPAPVAAKERPKPKIEKAIDRTPEPKAGKASRIRAAKAEPKKVPTSKAKTSKAKTAPKKAPLEPKPMKTKGPARADKPVELAEAKPAARKPAPAKTASPPKTGLDLGKLLASIKTEPKKSVVAKAVSKPAPPAAKPAPKPESRPEPPPEPRAAPPPEPVISRVATRDPCDLADPGEALVCANPSLRAADRQMRRLYRAAEDAGVAPGRLRQQQRRWLAARTAAARENPWAVSEVYEARIAELDDMRRDAGGY